MIRLICKKVQSIRPIASTTTHLYLFSTSTLKSTNTSNSTNPQSLTLSYLLKSCGLSLKSATSASKKLQLNNTENSDSVLNILKTHGLTQTHITNLITNRPLVLLADPNKTLKPNIELLATLGFFGTKLVKVINKDPRILESDAHTVVEFFRAYGFSEDQISAITLKRPTLYVYNAHKIFKPKLEFFKSLGFSGEDIAQILSSEPYILERSLAKQIIPSVEVIKRIVGTDESVLKAIKACYRILEFNLEEVLEPNIAVLMNHGVPKSKVLKLIFLRPNSLLLRTYRFTEVVKDVNKLGFDPNNFLFVLAISSMAIMSKALWDRKLALYCTFGLSEDEVLSAFKLQPMCMIASVNKITKLMGFYVNVLKLKPTMISKNPNLLLLSLEKRILPRCSVLQILTSKDQIKGKISIVYVFRMTEKMFAGRFVSKYKNVIPEVAEAYQCKIQFQGFTLNINM